MAQMVKNLPAMEETWVQSPGWEDPLEKGMTIHSSILAWRIPWTENLGGLKSMGLQRGGKTERVTHIHIHVWKLIHSARQQKLTQHCKSTVFQ